MASSGSAFAPVRNSSVSSDDSDVKTTIHFPKAESSFNTVPNFVPWWNKEAESHLLKPPMWSWWGLQNQRLPSMYRFASFSNASDDEKPTQSYIGLIAEAILSSPEEKLILSDIYGFILGNYPYFRNKGTGWRNSIRHNLSLNDCFVKAGRSQNGKGHFWAINHLYLDDFRRGDFRRKRAYKRPNRGKKARAKLDALIRKRESSCQEYLAPKSSPGKNIQKDQNSCESDAQKELHERGFDDERNMEGIKEKDNYMEQAHLPESPSLHEHERVVPSSPEWISAADEYQDVDVCSTEFEKGTPKSINIDSPKNGAEKKEGKERRDEARRSKSFDMDRLLAPERSAKEFGIFREMYPMYYNIMNLGMRNLEPVDCYGVPTSFCSHCCSMFGSHQPPHNETRHLYNAMPPSVTKSYVSSEFR
ncbi:forkhead box protein C1-B-like [Actinia tenebrosa]|uniref:Forkhead box protein C1-B-like n=1 Tax=Actinia tenebrosa TaxID=6105 RepID=A0A6P8HHL9_ACTTE|nr:forkhead box protein C1-B-like [Actinia tenebrosa]